MKKTIYIDSGTLELDIDFLHENYQDIEEILDFASRKNPKRGFMFVSKILGKCTPVKPSVMRSTYRLMTELVGPLTGNTLVVGMSEAATGLGGGIADSMATENKDNKVIFQHSTRHLLDHEQWFSVEEEHSHAVSHFVYKPSQLLINDVLSSDRMVLIDDEISTGKTLLKLAIGYLLHMKNVKHIDIVALVSWLDDDKTAWFKSALADFCDNAKMDMPSINFIHLAHGSFEFTNNPDFDSTLPEYTDTGAATEASSIDYGRLGLMMPVSANFQSYGLPKGRSLSILGTGEHQLFPFLYAESLESNSYDVEFHVVTRSPVFYDGEVIKSVDIVPIQRDSDSPLLHHYVYNLNKRNFVIPANETAVSESWYRHLTERNDQPNLAYFFTDIDDTLLQTTGKIPAGIDSIPLSKNINNKYIGSSTLYQVKLMEIMNKSGLMIPVTGRNSAGLNRCEINWDSYKIVSHGALVLNNDNTVNKKWLQHIESDVVAAKPELERLLAIINGMKEEVEETFMETINLSILEDQGLDIYLCGSQPTRNDFAQYLAEKIKEEIPLLAGWRLHINGRKFAVLPPYASKLRAVKFVKDLLSITDNDLTIGLGNSMSDVEFMSECKMLLAPKKSQINYCLRNSDQTGVTNV